MNSMEKRKYTKKEKRFIICFLLMILIVLIGSTLDFGMYVKNIGEEAGTKITGFFSTVF
ncbi:hypothetical protein [Miniphocaeibacter halophilus]|uniref:Uncharacterized protein n=1 Tax=Miniphocaeibacter halophilus TaxID=2931922 RepID=A0AC61MS30_9FIRM|nr:hypothetical protein [Miniphocaeibacter halophilus]QQK08316.1 hypothetical protein JFY71_01885 [Miniphocaeibacter halophilus]